MEIAANILISIMSNSNLKTAERFDQAPEVLEKLYKKIDELDKNTEQPTITIA
mgnify:FL=1